MNGSVTITVSPKSNLPNNDYSATITVSSGANAVGTATAELSIQGVSITVSPQSLGFSIFTNQQAQKTFVVSPPLEVSATPSATWIKVSPAHSQNGGTFTVTVDSTGVQPGATLNGSIDVFCAFASPCLDQIVSVSLSVTSPAQLSVSISQNPLPLTVAQGGTTQDTFKITNTGGSIGTFTVTASSTGGWLSTGTPTASIDPGSELNIAVIANAQSLTPGNYAGSVSVNDAIKTIGSFSVSLTVTGNGPSVTIKVIPQVADGGPWLTTIVVVNRTSASVTASLSFSMDLSNDASAVDWSPQIVENINYKQLPIPAHGAVFLHTPGTGSFTYGYAVLSAPEGVEAFAIFKQRVPGRQDQEGGATASAPDARVLVPFDNTQGNVTSIAMANSGSAQQTVIVTIRTASGMTLTDKLNLAAKGHKAFRTIDQFTATNGQQGTIEFSGAPASLTAIALRFNSSGAFTTVPTVSSPPAARDTVVSQVVDGGKNSDGSNVWQTTLVVVNGAQATAAARFKLMKDTTPGSPSAPWQLLLNNQLQSSVTLAPGTAQFLATPGIGNPLTIGYGVVSADAGIQVFAIFKQHINDGRQDQEATAQSLDPGREILAPFDNSLSNSTSMALVNNGTSDDTFTAKSLGSVQVPAGGHQAFGFAQQFSATAGLAGLADFTSTSSPFSLILLRFNSSNAFTAIPAFSAMP
jgi:hypothetical protein